MALYNTFSLLLQDGTSKLQHSKYLEYHKWSTHIICLLLEMLQLLKEFLQKVHSEICGSCDSIVGLLVSIVEEVRDALECRVDRRIMTN